MDNKSLIHIAMELIISSVIVLYFYKKTNELSQYIGVIHQRLQRQDEILEHHEMLLRKLLGKPQEALRKPLSPEKMQYQESTINQSQSSQPMPTFIFDALSPFFTATQSTQPNKPVVEEIEEEASENNSEKLDEELKEELEILNQNKTTLDLKEISDIDK